MPLSLALVSFSHLFVQAIRTAANEGDDRKLRWASHDLRFSAEEGAQLLARFRGALGGPAAGAGLLDQHRTETLLLETSRKKQTEQNVSSS
jgi:hypothetical protein